MVNILQLSYTFLVIFIIVIYEVSSDKKSRRKYNNSEEKSLWKKEYEDELTDAMLSSKKKDNFTRVVQSTDMSENEIVIEKLMDSITSSEKYLKKVDSVDFRLNRLDIEVHEKTNAILKRLTDIFNAVQTHPYGDKIESAIDNVKLDIGHIKNKLEHIPQSGKFDNSHNVEGAEYRVDPTLDNRLTFLENLVKAILSNVESISSTISEVKTRQYSRNFPKPNVRSDTNINTLEAVNLITEFRRALHDQKTRKCDCKIGRSDRVERYPTDCYEIQIQGFNVSGIYKIKPEDMEPFYVLCDLTTAGGGWTLGATVMRKVDIKAFTAANIKYKSRDFRLKQPDLEVRVFQNRFDGSQDFYKSWPEYKHGFGNLAGEFWLGLEKLNFLTNQKLYELRIEIESQLGQEAFAGYSVFTIGPEHEGYRISTLGAFHGTAGDSLSYHAGQKFSTYDIDNDEWKDGSCATEHGGAWWYKECDKSNLNGKYSLNAEEQQGQSIYWISFKAPTTPLTKTRLMIRPLPASKPVDTFDYPRKIDPSRLRPMGDKKAPRKNEPNVARAPYRYEDTPRHDAFFPNYA